MKKILSLSVLSLAALLTSQQQASAWINWKFGVGLNTQFQSGGNNWAWGVFRNGQPPGPEMYGYGYPGHGHGHGHGPFAPAPFPPGHYAPTPVPAAPAPSPMGYYPAYPGFAPAPEAHPASMFQNVNYVPYHYNYGYGYYPMYYSGTWYR